MRSIALVLLPFVASLGWLLGCSGGTSAPLSPSPSAPTIDSGKGEGSEAGASSPDAALSSADAGVADDRIDPIAVGHAWTYDVTVMGRAPICEGGEHTGAVLGESVVDGQEAFQIESFCAAAGTSSYTVDGDRVKVDYEGQWILALDPPVQEGHTWSNGAETFTWHDAGSVNAPAGTFDDCWSAAENVAAPSYTVFCRGVGPVRWHSEDGSGSGWDAQLSAKNF